MENLDKIIEQLERVDKRLDKIELLIHILYNIPYENDKIKIEPLEAKDKE